MKTRLLRKLGPLGLIGLAVLLNLVVALRPNPVIDFGPFDLTPGTTKQVTFQAGYTETYAIGVRMNRETAERMYPCTVSVDAMQKAECKTPASPWPVVLALKASSNGRNLTGEITPSTSLAGGQYEGADTYTWVGAHIRLATGETYHLDVRSIGRASSLQSAQPHLVISAAGAPGLMESNAIGQMIALCAGILLLAGAAIWAMINERWRRTAAA
ncbi:MAG: hypothetical protein EOP62_10250 [Sphingomonadales bacterium]|nr:MAG: hypothetical protein EOP62_10250 [Sphingomonadales bacterium]